MTCRCSCFMEGTAWKPRRKGAAAPAPMSSIQDCATPCHPTRQPQEKVLVMLMAILASTAFRAFVPSPRRK